MDVLIHSHNFFFFPRPCRKSWLVPTQYLLGLFMLYLSMSVNSLLQSEGGPQVVMLTAVFFMLAFLAATQVRQPHRKKKHAAASVSHQRRDQPRLPLQDIAVDGWALTMLSRENVGYASTCNSVGQTAGYFLGNVLFLALESADFCNKYLRVEPKDTGIVTLSGSPPPHRTDTNVATHVHMYLSINSVNE